MKLGQCIHFNGIQHDCCRADVNYRMLANDAIPGMALRLPCWTPTSGRNGNSPAMCEKYQSVTDSQVAEYKAEMEAYMDRIKKVMPVVSEWRKKSPRGKNEVIECPACNGNLHLTQASSNGHVWGKCETEGCVSWME